MAFLLAAAFFLSGASALIFETLWFREAGLAFGNSVWASSLVLSGFMAGLALGNLLAAVAFARGAATPRCEGWPLRNPVLAYAIAEAAIAATGVALVYLFVPIGSSLAPMFRPLIDRPWLLNPLRLTVAFLLLLVPSTAMGITLPLLTQALASRTRSFGTALGALYGWNTLGAMAGVLIGESYLVGWYGIRGTAIAAGALNVVAAAIGAIVGIKSESGDAAFLTPTRATSRRKGLNAPSPNSESGTPDHATPTWRWLVAAFAAGFALLALEVIWFRFLLLFVKGHSMAFPLMLGVVLAGIALGGLVASLWMRWSAQAHRFAPAVALFAGAACAFSYARFPHAIEPLGLSSITGATAILQVAVPLMLPVSLLSGIFFTLTGVALRDQAGSNIEATGVLTLANTIGAASGSLVAGFLLLPELGIERSIFGIASLYVFIGVFLWWFAPREWRAVKARPTLIAFAAAVLALFTLITFPFGELTNELLPIPVTRWAEGEPERRVVAVHEGRTETVVFFQRMLLGKPVSDVMLTNSFSMSTTGYGVRRYQKLYVYWPMAVHPAIRRALLIGYGVGNTAKAMTDSPSLDSIDLVDLSRDILSMAPIVFPNPAAAPLNDPRMHVHIEDGRYFLQATDRTFDLITGEPPPPGIAGVENLYSREYFALMRDRLAEGGIVTYWLPLADLSDVSAKAILRAFCDVFDDCSLWNGSGTNLMLVGTRGLSSDGAGRALSGPPVSEDQFSRQWRDPTVSPEMERLGIERPEQLGALFIGDASFVRALADDAPPLTDDRPKLIEAPFSSQEDATRLFAAVTDTGAARTRFQSSAFIARLWPKPLIDASVPYFDVQHVIDAHMYGNQVHQNLALDDVHRVLTGSQAGTPVQWRLASNADIQQAIDASTPQEQMNPVMQYHLAIRYLSERRYRNAADAFNRATAAPDVRDNAFVLYIYSLCMSGQVRQAQAISHEAFAASGATTLPPIWIWMKETFGLDPARG